MDIQPRHYLHLVPGTPIDGLYRRFFQQGFPVLSLSNGLPDLYKRAEGSVFWKLDLDQMSATQRAAIRDWYLQAVRPQKISYQVDWSDMGGGYESLLAEAGVEANSIGSYMTVEPANLAIAFCEHCPSLARYCVPQDYWEALVRSLMIARLHQDQLLQEELLRVKFQQPQTHQAIEASEWSQQPVRAAATFDHTIGPYF